MMRWRDIVCCLDAESGYAIPGAQLRIARRTPRNSLMGEFSPANLLLSKTNLFFSAPKKER